jgi:hypothetical protein
MSVVPNRLLPPSHIRKGDGKKILRKLVHQRLSTKCVTKLECPLVLSGFCIEKLPRNYPNVAVPIPISVNILVDCS